MKILLESLKRIWGKPAAMALGALIGAAVVLACVALRSDGCPFRTERTDNDSSPGKFYSQQGEDKYLYERFWKDKRGGTFVELGAGDGVLYSNTKFFEDTLGWRGVLIEPVPEQFGRLKKNRPLAGSFKIAICRGNTDSTMVDMVGTGPTAGMLRTMDPGFKQDWHAGDTNFYKVHGGPISTVLHVAGIEMIDLFSIDVEGAEEEVVQTMDWAIPVHIIVIELDGRNKARDDRITTYLTEKGFTYFNRIGGNCYFENKAFPRIQARTASSD